MKKIWIIIIFVPLAFIVWKLKNTKQSMTVVLPEKTVFFIDPELSESVKSSMTDVIAKSYATSKDPQNVIDQTSTKYPEISSMKVQICQSDKICFYVDAAAPIFLMNDCFVVCDNANKIEQNHFSAEIVKNLVSVSCGKGVDLQNMVCFVQALPDFFKQNFSIEWNADSDIVLVPKNSKEFRLQVCVDGVPSMQDMKLCETIGAGLSKKYKSKNRCTVYDLRFKNQIIVR